MGLPKLLSKFKTLIFFAAIGLTATAVFFYAKGYRFDPGQGGLTKTGILVIKSAPDGAKIYLDDVLVSATNETVQNLTPGKYKVRLEKEGYFAWEKEIPIKAELVTNIDALLPPLSPALFPLTNSGIELPTASPSGTRIVFIADTPKAGLYNLSLSQPALIGAFRSPINLLFEETAEVKITAAEQIFWSPDESQLLLKIGAGYFLFDLSTGQTALTSEPDKYLTPWEKERSERFTKILEGSDLGKTLLEEGTAPATIWASDQKKFLYVKTTGDKREFFLANLGKTLGVGEIKHEKIFETLNPDLKILWHADSFHFITLEGDNISIMDIDGTNPFKTFSGTLGENFFTPSPDAGGIIVLTRFSEASPLNLYSISLR